MVRKMGHISCFARFMNYDSMELFKKYTGISIIFLDNLCVPLFSNTGDIIAKNMNLLNK